MAIQFAQMSAYILPPVLVPSVVSVDYSPDVLLNVSELDTTVTACRSFWEYCEWGYHSYFESAEEEDQVVYEHGPHSSVEVVDSVVRSLCTSMRSHSGETFVYVVGMCVGWLSAIFQVQPGEAAIGMHVLLSIVRTTVEEHMVKFSNG